MSEYHPWDGVGLSVILRELPRNNTSPEMKSRMRNQQECGDGPSYSPCLPVLYLSTETVAKKSRERLVMDVYQWEMKGARGCPKTDASERIIVYR
jgi:hypothetical protein